MFRQAVKQSYGSDPFAEMETAIQQTKDKFAAMPLSPVKKRITDVYFNYWRNKISKLNFFSATAMVFTADQQIDLSERFFNLLQFPDDKFLVEARLLALTVSEKSSLRTNLLSEINVATDSLATRRESLHQTALYTAIGATLFTLYQRPTLGLLTLGVEIVTLLNVDIKKQLNKMLEIYDSTGYMDVMKDGVTERHIMTTYKG
mgnify:CR=1 FL=1|tara:strand:+ start:2097 stop:2705 length:609 start_codon:yes stop_codon:yes gene_type:complete